MKNKLKKKEKKRKEKGKNKESCIKEEFKIKKKMYLQKESLSYGEYMTNVIFLLVDGLSIMVKKKKKEVEN